MKVVTPKFPDCKGCRFFSKKVIQPICRECGCGEFYEPKITPAALDEDDINSYGETYDD